MCNPSFDLVPDQAAEPFAHRLLDIGNSAGAALMLSVGHRTGLFDTLSELPASTSDEIADAAGLDERYVREWLAAMTVSGIVLYDPVRHGYRLPREHAAYLTRTAGLDNLALLMQYISVLGSVEDRIVECFRNGGGVPYSAFGRFHEVMAEDSGLVVDHRLLEDILPLVPRLAKRLGDGIDVLDVGCGSGRAMAALAQAFPASRFVGYDWSAEAIERARDSAREQELSNVRFEIRDVAALEERDRFDLVTAFDAIHDQAHPAKVLAGIHRALRPEGLFLMQDIAASSRLEDNLDHPLGPLLYAISCMHCMSVSLASGGDGLGTMWGEEQALRLLAEAGFPAVDVHHLPDDLQHIYFVARPAA